MSKGKLDVENLKFIPIEKVPPVIKKTKWDIILEKIPVGQALVLTKEEANPATVRSAVRKYQKMGKFSQLKVTTRKINGKRVTYVLNPTPEPETTTKGWGTVTPQKKVVV